MRSWRYSCDWLWMEGVKTHVKTVIPFTIFAMLLTFSLHSFHYYQKPQFSKTFLRLAGSGLLRWQAASKHNDVLRGIFFSVNDHVPFSRLIGVWYSISIDESGCSDDIAVWYFLQAHHTFFIRSISNIISFMNRFYSLKIDIWRWCFSFYRIYGQLSNSLFVVERPARGNGRE